MEQSLLGPLWEDEETKSFYEELADLKAFIPAILYKESSANDKTLEEEEEEKDQGRKRGGEKSVSGSTQWQWSESGFQRKW